MKKGFVSSFMALSITAALLCSTGFTSSADYSPLSAAGPKILCNIQRVKVSSSSLLEVNRGKYTSDRVSVANSKSKQILKSFDLSTDKIENVEVIESKALGKTVNRAELGNAQVDFDESGNIVQIKNNDDFTTVDKDKRNYTDNTPLPSVPYKYNKADDLNSIINNIVLTNDLQKYKLVDCNNNIDGVWNLTWDKVLENGVLNPYDVVVATIDAKDGSIMEFVRNTVTPDIITSTVSKAQAIKLAQPIIKRFNPKKTDAALTVTRPNFYWEEGGPYQPANFVRLAWKIDLDNSKTTIMIDANTGEILGGSQTQSSDYGRALGPVTKFYKNTECVNMAYNGLNALGYKQPSPLYSPVSWQISQSDIDYLFNNSNIYGLYLKCHGLEDRWGNFLDAITDEQQNWTKYASQVNGNWHFVYLDACKTSSDWAFANAMHATSSGRCFMGWNVTIATDTAYEFNSRFWPKIGSMSIHDAVISARDQTLAAGYSDCNPGFHGDIAYYGWAW